MNREIGGAEMLTIGADMEITDEGFLCSSSNLDTCLVEGVDLALYGTLRADDLNAFNGLLGTTSNGDLFSGEGFEMAERGTLTKDLAGNGADSANGIIRINGAFKQTDTLALVLQTTSAPTSATSSSSARQPQASPAPLTISTASTSWEPTFSNASAKTQTPSLNASFRYTRTGL